MDSAEYRRKLDKAFSECDAAGLSKYAYNPYFDRLMRLLGFKPVPLPYTGWRGMFRVFLFFSIAISGSLQLFYWLLDLFGADGASADGSAFRIIVTSLLMVVGFAAGQVWEAQAARRKYDLPDWEEL